MLTSALKRYIRFVFPAAFLMVCMLALGMRFRHTFAAIRWHDDTARDLMIAKRIARSGTFAAIAPCAGMSGGKIQNSYLYYNLLGLFWSFGDRAASVIYIFTLLGCLSLLAGFEIGRQIGGKWLALSCLLALAVNTYIAHYQISVYQRSILPSAALVLVMLSIHAIKKKSFLSLFILHSFFLFSLLIHYSMATLIIPLAVVTLITLHINQLAFKQKAFYVLGTGIGALALFLILTGTSLTQATSFFFSTQKSTVWHEENISLQDTLLYQ